MDKRLLSILRCPVTQKGLSVANRDTLKRVNAAIADGKLSNRDGQAVSGAWTEALLTDDSKLLYPVSNGTPVLLEGESVAMEQLGPVNRP